MKMSWFNFNFQNALFLTYYRKIVQSLVDFHSFGSNIEIKQALVNFKGNTEAYFIVKFCGVG